MLEKKQNNQQNGKVANELIKEKRAVDAEISRLQQDNSCLNKDEVNYLIQYAADLAHDIQNLSATKEAYFKLYVIP